MIWTADNRVYSIAWLFLWCPTVFHTLEIYPLDSGEHEYDTWETVISSQLPAGSNYDRDYRCDQNDIEKYPVNCKQPTQQIRITYHLNLMPLYQMILDEWELHEISEDPYLTHAAHSTHLSTHYITSQYITLRLTSSDHITTHLISLHHYISYHHITLHLITSHCITSHRVPSHHRITSDFICYHVISSPHFISTHHATTSLAM